MNENYHIINNVRSPSLLSEDACLALGLITYAPGGYYIRTARKTEPTDLPTFTDLPEPERRRIDQFHRDYANVYQGLGCLKGFEAELELGPDVKTFYHRASPVPQALCAPGKQGSTS